MIVLYETKSQRRINNHRIQVLLWALQGTCVLKKDELLFRENFLAWETGPAILEAYKMFMGYGYLSIDPKSFKQKDLDYSREKMRVYEKMINTTLDECSQYSTETLNDIFMGTKLFKEAKDNHMLNSKDEGFFCDKDIREANEALYIISNEDFLKYYRKLKGYD